MPTGILVPGPEQGPGATGPGVTDPGPGANPGQPSGNVTGSSSLGLYTCPANPPLATASYSVVPPSFTINAPSLCSVLGTIPQVFEDVPVTITGTLNINFGPDTATFEVNLKAVVDVKFTVSSDGLDYVISLGQAKKTYKSKKTLTSGKDIAKAESYKQTSRRRKLLGDMRRHLLQVQVDSTTSDIECSLLNDACSKVISLILEDVIKGASDLICGELDVACVAEIILLPELDWGPTEVACVAEIAASAACALFVNEAVDLGVNYVCAKLENYLDASWIILKVRKFTRELEKEIFCRLGCN